MKPLILIIEDDAVLNRLLQEQIAAMGYRTAGVHSWREARAWLEHHEPQLVLLDCRLPDADGLDILPQLTPLYPVIILTAYASVSDAVRAVKEGAAEYLVKPVNLDELELTLAHTLDNVNLRQSYQLCKRKLETQDTPLVGKSTALQHVRRLIEAVAPSNMTVLIQGESGVGKELVAREIHRRSLRRDREYVTLDCCSLQETLFESELFGHERGAFTGAHKQKKGLIEVASGGTLFLDEIGEISLSIQAKLLRVLETGRFRRLGGIKDLQADVRILAATNRDLEKMCREGTFREDLYFRLNAFNIQVPPLRERREDIPELVNLFLNQHGFPTRTVKKVTEKAMHGLMAYEWPGNVRELKNVVERAIILSGNEPEIRPEHLAFVAAPRANTQTVLAFDHDPTLEEIERHYLALLLRKYRGHRAQVARTMGISERHTYRLIKKYGLESLARRPQPS